MTFSLKMRSLIVLYDEFYCDTVKWEKHNRGSYVWERVIGQGKKKPKTENVVAAKTKELKFSFELCSN
jgi:hypothetical protein